jgi:cytochrome P450
MTRAPGPEGAKLLLRTILTRRRDPVGFHEALRGSYGDCVRIRLGDTSHFLISGIPYVKHVLLDNHRNYTKGPNYELMAAILGRGLITSEGEHWRRHRRLVQPSLQAERMRGFTAVMVDAATEEARALERAADAGTTVDVFARMMDLALRIVSRTLLGSELGGREADVHHAVTEVLDHLERLSVSGARFLELLPGGSRLRGLQKRLATLPTRNHRRFRAAIATLDRVIYDVIDRGRRTPAGRDGDDLVSLLLAAREAERGGMSDEEIRDEVMTMFLAGHETTATALTWCLYLLAAHPAYAEAVAREASAVLGERDPNAGDLPKLGLAERVFQEAMRLYPPVWRFSRFAVGPDRLGEYDVPRGSVVIVSSYLVHRDPALWPEPTRFDPDRFAPEQSVGRPRLAFIPFGVGQRMCIGATFATVEAQIILSVLTRAVAFELPHGHTVGLEPRVTLRPRGGMRLLVRRRRPSERAAVAGASP